MRVYRIQDEDGRGPFRPGAPAIWADEYFAPGMRPLPSWMEEFGADLIQKNGRPGEYFGSAVRLLGDLRKWFSGTEMAKLEALGFEPVCLQAQRVLAESEHQLVFARYAPLIKGAIVVPWPDDFSTSARSAAEEPCSEGVNT